MDKVMNDMIKMIINQMKFIKKKKREQNQNQALIKREKNQTEFLHRIKMGLFVLCLMKKKMNYQLMLIIKIGILHSKKTKQMYKEGKYLIDLAQN